MDVAQITDISQLKAMAYDNMATQEAAAGNLRIINERIREIQSSPQPDPQPPIAPNDDPLTITAEPATGEQTQDEA